RTYSFEPGEHEQIGRLISSLGGGDVDGAWVSITSSTGSAELFAYASVVDNASGDPTFIAPARTPRTARPLDAVIPSIAHAPGSFGTDWKSELTIHNPTAETAD